MHDFLGRLYLLNKNQDTWSNMDLFKNLWIASMELQPDSSYNQVQVEPSTPLCYPLTSALSALLQLLLFHLPCSTVCGVHSHMATDGPLFKSGHHRQPSLLPLYLEVIGSQQVSIHLSSPAPAIHWLLLWDALLPSWDYFKATAWSIEHWWLLRRYISGKF